ncbi:YcxB family protein [uncultured Brachyspira sp.]|uniref:YcxB family protein n=1 Tax=uncultured Brachyspira sp. TaxID=221953 RepID=UPI0026349B10|nr:YcxB family protein [uncultured Brachyspira sp.]
MKKEYKYRLTEDDFIDFQLHYLKSNSNMNSSVKKTIIILVVLYIVVFASMAIYFRDNAFLIVVIALLVSAFSILQILTYKKRLEKKIVKKVKEYVRSGKLDKVFGDKELTIYDNKVVFKEDRGTSEFNKDEIIKIDSTNKCVFFYIDEMSAIIIPKQILNSEDIDLLLSYKK